MAKATFVHEGDVISYTPTVDVPAGTVLKHGFWVGVAKQAIPANKRGSLAITGVFDIPKPAGEAIVFVAGGDVFWNIANQIGFPTLLDPGDGYMGHAVEAAPNEANTVRVRLHMSPNVMSS